MEKIKNLTLAACTLLGLYSASGMALDSYGETYMTAQQAQKKFGSEPFSAEKFKNGDRKVRGQMAADLVLKKSFVGRPLKSVAQLLGTPDGYFENKGVPAYIISPDIDKKDVWQLVFLPDKDWKKVDEVKIHKNCCD
jgi:hypothetical protein